MGFDLVEVPIENPGDFDYARAGAIARDHGLAVTVCAAMSPDRDLIHPDESIRANGMAYVRHCIEAAYTMGSSRVGGPLYSAVGRTWQATADERASYMDLLVTQLKGLAAHAADHGVVLGVEPLNRFETSVLNLTADAIAVVDRVGQPRLRADARHVPHEHRGTVHWRRHPRGRPAAAAPARLRERSRRAGVGTRAVERGRPGAARHPGYDEGVVIESFTSQVKSIARAAAIWRPARGQPGRAGQERAGPPAGAART